MSTSWLLVFFVSVVPTVLCSDVVEDNRHVAEDHRHVPIGEKLVVIIRDVSEYLLWLIGYGNNEPIEDQIDEAEIITKAFLKDVNEMIDLMHDEADEHIKHLKDMRYVEEENRPEYDDKVNSDERIPPWDVTSSEDTSDAKEERKEKSDNTEVLPI